MTNENNPAFPTMEHGYDNTGLPTVRTEPGITKLEYMTAFGSNNVPEFYYHIKLKEFNDAKGITRTTDGHPAKIMSCNEIVETIASWRVKIAKALINELNKQQ